ncbi:MAG: general secretion pathway protein GspK [Calditerrivibrio sp.]|nr:general secretion pathway protein GspK [Calditerrivibrio sp.]
MIFLLVLFLVAALTVATVDMSEDSFIAKKYMKHLVTIQEVRLLEKTVSTVFKDIFKKDDANIDSLEEDWAKPYFFPTKLGNITIEIVDQERFLNPNSIVDPQGKMIESVYRRYLRLFEHFNIPQKILDNIVDWIDNNTTLNAKFDNDTVPIKNSIIKSLDELRYVSGVDDKIFFGDIDKGGFVPGLRTFFSPFSNGKVNINTAGKYVLLGLDERMDEQLADRIIDYRKDKRFKSVDDLINVNGVTIDMIFRLRQITDVKSDNFLVLIKIEKDDSLILLSMLYRREGSDLKKIWRRLE